MASVKTVASIKTSENSYPTVLSRLHLPKVRDRKFCHLYLKSRAIGSVGVAASCGRVTLHAGRARGARRRIREPCRAYREREQLLHWRAVRRARRAPKHIRPGLKIQQRPPPYHALSYGSAHRLTKSTPYQRQNPRKPSLHQNRRVAASFGQSGARPTARSGYRDNAPDGGLGYPRTTGGAS
jgi:hypothetical protein